MANGQVVNAIDFNQRNFNSIPNTYNAAQTFFKDLAQHTHTQDPLSSFVGQIVYHITRGNPNEDDSKAAPYQVVRPLLKSCVDVKQMGYNPFHSLHQCSCQMLEMLPVKNVL